ncbi:MAG: GNAT family N-acetyltransferase [Candidatus Lokiarchaeota archaeon]|nr:GNAT family N-acetyltransferase [Candidatus Lokiarchaeota archaeon]
MIEIRKVLHLPINKLKIASNILSKAFQHDPIFNYIILDTNQRLKTLNLYFQHVIKYGLCYGEVYSSPNFEGISVWLPPKNSSHTRWKAIKTGALALPVKVKWKYLTLQNKIYKFTNNLHKKFAPYPHWYLSLIGVGPNHQGIGFGQQLLSTTINKIDLESKPIYLETNKEKNVELFKQFGFCILQKVILPGTKIFHWSLLRNPIK